MSEKELYHKRKEQGLCVKCGKPALPNETKCDFHKKLHRKAVKKIHDKRKSLGLCVKCGKPALPNETKCDFHKKLHRKVQEKNRNKNTENNRCRCCGRELLDIGIDSVTRKTCIVCRTQETFKWT